MFPDTLTDIHSVDHNVDDYRPTVDRPGGQDTSVILDDFITPSHLDALTACVLAMRSALDAFIALKVDQLPTLPIVWSTYAMVCMIRLESTLLASRSRYASIFLPDLKVRYYLDAIIARFQETSGPLSKAPANMFLQAFERLRLWHEYRVRPETSDNIAQGDSRQPSATAPSLGQATAYQTTTLNTSQAAMPSVSSGSHVGYTYDNSWASNTHMPIDSSMFENLDWGSIGDFDASMSQPANGPNWLGFLL